MPSFTRCFFIECILNKFSFLDYVLWYYCNVLSLNLLKTYFLAYFLFACSLIILMCENCHCVCVHFSILSFPADFLYVFHLWYLPTTLSFAWIYLIYSYFLSLCISLDRIFLPFYFIAFPFLFYSFSTFDCCFNYIFTYTGSSDLSSIFSFDPFPEFLSYFFPQIKIFPDEKT